MWGYKKAELYEKLPKVPEQGNNIIRVLFWGTHLVGLFFVRNEKGQVSVEMGETKDY